MADYISRESAVKVLTSIWMQVSDSRRRAVAKCINEIELLHAADVAPVRHGRPMRTWIDEYYGEWTECSVCGWDNPADAKYCNGCGARMDEGAENG